MIEVELIAAVSANKGIGLGGEMPWHIPEELKHFKALTEGHVVLMGRKTAESIGKPLKDRINLVLTHAPGDDPVRQEEVRQMNAKGFVPVHNLPEIGQVFDSLRRTRGFKGKLMVIGGAQVYELMMPYASAIHLTTVETNTGKVPLCDTFFPPMNGFTRIAPNQVQPVPGMLQPGQGYIAEAPKHKPWTHYAYSYAMLQRSVPGQKLLAGPLHLVDPKTNQGYIITKYDDNAPRCYSLDAPAPAVQMESKGEYSAFNEPEPVVPTPVTWIIDAAKDIMATPD